MSPGNFIFQVNMGKTTGEWKRKLWQNLGQPAHFSIGKTPTPLTLSPDRWAVPLTKWTCMVLNDHSLLCFSFFVLSLGCTVERESNCPCKLLWEEFYQQPIQVIWTDQICYHRITIILPSVRRALSSRGDDLNPLSNLITQHYSHWLLSSFFAISFPCWFLSI